MTSSKKVLSTLSHWAIKTVQSTTGLNVANICHEFGLYPLMHGSSMFTVNRKLIPKNHEENLKLLSDLLEQQLVKPEPSIVSELQTVIDNICKR